MKKRRIIIAVISIIVVAAMVLFDMQCSLFFFVYVSV